MPNYEKIANKITERTGKKLKEQKNLYLIGTGGGMMHDIQLMSMSFDYYQEVNLLEFGQNSRLTDQVTGFGGAAILSKSIEAL